MNMSAMGGQASGGGGGGGGGGEAVAPAWHAPHVLGQMSAPVPLTTGSNERSQPNIPTSCEHCELRSTQGVSSGGGGGTSLEGGGGATAIDCPSPQYPQARSHLLRLSHAGQNASAQLTPLAICMSQKPACSVTSSKALLHASVGGGGAASTSVAQHRPKLNANSAPSQHAASPSALTVVSQQRP